MILLFAKAFGSWCWSNRKLLAILIVLGSLVLYGYRWGARDIQAEWDASAARQRAIVQAEKDGLQKRNDDLSRQYQEYRRRSADSMHTIRGELAHEISTNSGLRGCLATPEFVRIYEGAGAALPDTHR